MRERYFLVREQLKVTQQLWKYMHKALSKFLLEFINLNEMNAKEVALAGDFSVAGSLNFIKDYYDKLTAIDPKYGYFPKPKKSYLKIKKNLMEAQNLFANSRVNITAGGKKHLGAVIGSIENREEYVKNLVKDWDNLPFCQLLQKHNR